ncbi:hypothetical protein QYE76_023829 [Lolium multiflorum]|uniref:Retrotransposon Copia-like N-terminal domain-containing protein n=1 Tax=Lolium multiflorum TaxID=4521 RepID=A0AAD8RDP6_LOLMU|nr:hypothetical protein QYE76_023829 [Lolium multiflorum]
MDKENANPIVHGAVGPSATPPLFDAVPNGRRAVPSTDVTAVASAASEAAAAGRGQIPPGWDPYEPVPCLVATSAATTSTMTSRLARCCGGCRSASTSPTSTSPRVSIGAPSALGGSAADFNCVLTHAENIGHTNLKVGASVNPNSFRAKHLALGMHLSSIQRVEISGGRMPPLKPKAPKGATSGGRGRWGRRSPGRVLLLPPPFFSNPFADSSIPDPGQLRAVAITDHVPVKLSTTDANYLAWKTYFYLLFREYNLRGQIDGTADLLARDSDWLAINATIIRWLFLTVSPDIFKTVVREGDDARTVWVKINGPFTNNKLQRVVFLQQEFSTP